MLLDQNESHVVVAYLGRDELQEPGNGNRPEKDGNRFQPAQGYKMSSLR
jgi:hypothetical protein